MITSQGLIRKYLNRRQVDLQTCQSALVNGDFETLEQVGHRLKGNGKDFGFPEITQIGESLETAAQQQGTVSASRCILSLKKIIG